ncbi:MAG: hypothetical protein V4585_01935 [Bacteroidota bacterium]
MFRLLKIWHLLSLDVVLGAMICNIMFWKLSVDSSHIPIPVVTILGFSVWIVYILDRFFDNKKTSQSSTERHTFHKKHAKTLWICIGFSTLFCVCLLFFIPFKIFLLGIVTSFLTATYLFFISKVSAQNPLQHYKEPITALVYVIGVFGTAILEKLTFWNIIIGLIFLLIAFQNLLLFSLSEFKQNPACHTLASNFGVKKSNNIITIITILVILIGTYSRYFSVVEYQEKVFSVEILMSTILLTINLLDSFFLTNDRYRWVGDGIFLLPLFIIL